MTKNKRQLDVTVKSPALGGRNVQVRLLLPRKWSMKSKRTWPILYVYHGGHDNWQSWTKNTDIETTAAKYDAIVAMPEGDNGSYTDWFNGGKGGIPKWETWHIKEVIPLIEGVKKIEAACLARKDDAFAIIARTDALAVEGIEGTLRRARAYAEAGADLIFADAIRSEEQITRLVEAARVPVTVNMGFGIRSRPTTPLIPARQLQDMGVAAVSYPRILSAAAIQGMKNALAALNEQLTTGTIVDRTDLLVSFQELNDLMGLGQLKDIEKRFLTEAQFKGKYGG